MLFQDEIAMEAKVNQTINNRFTFPLRQPQIYSHTRAIFFYDAWKGITSDNIEFTAARQGVKFPFCTHKKQ